MGADCALWRHAARDGIQNDDLLEVGRRCPKVVLPIMIIDVFQPVGSQAKEAERRVNPTVDSLQTERNVLIGQSVRVGRLPSKLGMYCPWSECIMNDCELSCSAFEMYTDRAIDAFNQQTTACSI